MKAFDFGAPGVTKVLRYIDYLVLARTDNAAIQVNIERDYGARQALSTSLPQEGPQPGFTWGAVGDANKWGTGRWGGTTSDIQARTPLRGKGRVFRPTFFSSASSKATSSSFHLKGVSFRLQTTGKKDG